MINVKLNNTVKKIVQDTDIKMVHYNAGGEYCNVYKSGPLCRVVVNVSNFTFPDGSWKKCGKLPTGISLPEDAWPVGMTCLLGKDNWYPVTGKFVYVECRKDGNVYARCPEGGAGHFRVQGMYDRFEFSGGGDIKTLLTYLKSLALA